jgi:hypothetical protein
MSQTLDEKRWINWGVTVTFLIGSAMVAPPTLFNWLCQAAKKNDLNSSVLV